MRATTLIALLWLGISTIAAFIPLNHASLQEQLQWEMIGR